MEEEVFNMWEKFSLVEEEEEGISFDQPVSETMKAKSSLCLIGKLLSQKNFNLEAFRNTMDLAWKPARGMEVKIVGEKLLLFYFNSIGDKNRVLNGCPWSFDKHLLLIEEFNGDVQPSAMVLRTASFWIQIYDLPLNRMDKITGELIGNKIGSCVEVDTNLDGIGWGRFLRVRVAIDISKLLKRGMKFKKEDGTFSWISFRYERLPNFCYSCGRLDHGERECKNVREGLLQAQQYGVWLKAGVDRRRWENQRGESRGGGRKESEEYRGGGLSRATNSESWLRDKVRRDKVHEDTEVDSRLHGEDDGTEQNDAEDQNLRVVNVLLGEKSSINFPHKINVPPEDPNVLEYGKKQGEFVPGNGKGIATNSAEKVNGMEVQQGEMLAVFQRDGGKVLGEGVLVDVDVMSSGMETGTASVGGKTWKRIARGTSQNLSQPKEHATVRGKRRFYENIDENFSGLTQQKKRSIGDDSAVGVVSSLAVAENRHRQDQ